jgi:thioesterase domain-containing protein
MPRRAAALAAAALAGAGGVLLAQHLALLARRRLERGADAHDFALDVDGRGAGATRGWLQAALWRTIPVTRAMRVRVPPCEAQPGEEEEEDARPLCVAAPLHDNRNIHGTAFAGSLHAAAVLAGWGWLELHARRGGGRLGEANVVVRATHMRYLAPVTADFVATAQPPTPQELATCVRAKAVACLLACLSACVRVRALLCATHGAARLGCSRERAYADECVSVRLTARHTLPLSQLPRGV